MVAALILVGGYGTRLRPLTFSKAKPLVECASSFSLESVVRVSEREMRTFPARQPRHRPTARSRFPPSSPPPLFIYQVCNMAILEHQVEALVAVGVKKIVLAVSYKAEDMMASLATYEKKYGITVVCSLEETPMGTGALWLCVDF